MKTGERLEGFWTLDVFGGVERSVMKLSQISAVRRPLCRP